MNTKTEETKENKEEVQPTEKELRDAERAKINVTTLKKEEEKVEDKEEDEKEEDVKKEEKEEVDNKTEDNIEGDEEENNEEDEEPSAEELKRTVAKLQKRLEKTNGKNKDIVKELADAKIALAAKKAEDGDVLTEEEVEKRANIKANQALIERQFAEDCNKIFDGAAAVIKTGKQTVKEAEAAFKKKIDALTNDTDIPVPGAMIGILADLDNGGAVFNYLTDNSDEYETLSALSEGRMGVKLKEISDKLKTNKKKVISKVPEPIEPIGSGGRTTTRLNSGMTDAEWIEQRNKDVENKRRAGRHNLR